MLRCCVLRCCYMECSTACIWNGIRLKAAILKGKSETTKMKLVFLLAILASLAVLSLSAPLKPQKIDADEAMLEALASSLNVPNAGESELETNVASDSAKKVRYIRIQSRAGRNNVIAFSWLACYDLYGALLCIYLYSHDFF